MIAAVADEVSQRADRLLSLWSELSLLHVALGGACACGTGGISLRLDDFELDIVGYLEDVGLRSGITEVVDFFGDLQKTGMPSQPLRQILEIARNDQLSVAVADWLLPKLEKTLRSFAELHGPKARD